MPSKLVRLELDEGFELVVNLDKITFIHKTADRLSISFGNDHFLPLTGDAAESFWRCLRGSVLTIHHATPGAAPQTKIAEVPTHKDFSEKSNDD
ncbi:MAG: hypothetical protein RMX63_34565 [Aulosira sp. ZfuCHP01]|nr:hypothetical protein [Aulosira sp. ZfuVER01]MDZ8002342.1 hypothetical protein [Aulosira sp. DedVER01a]MDZ8056550.1 hypothetical protein [Aulosira sp. ZfuCHP01]